MPFKQFFAPLLDQELGVCSIILADWEGEAVDCVARQGEVEDAKIFGAHQGILLNHFRRCLAVARFGEIQEVLIRTDRVDWFVFPITSEYYLALCAESTAYYSRISIVAKECVVRLREELDS